MSTTYPPGWVARVERAVKLSLDPDAGIYRAPIKNIEVRADAVDARTSAYLKAEAARRKRRLSADDESLCRKYVLLVANWDTGTWTPRPTATPASGTKRRSGERSTPSPAGRR